MEAAEEMEALLSSAQPGSLIDPNRFVVEERQMAPRQVVRLLRPHMREARWEGIEQVVSGRTYSLVPVVEGLVNTGNVSAVMRSAEAMGCQGFHVVTGGEAFKTSERTSRGAEKWLDVWRWSAPADCAAYLKEQGYTVVATHLDEEAVSIGELDFTEKTALVFGNEKEGVSSEMLAHADRSCVVPTSGFVQSFNISVAAAVCLYHGRQDRLRRQGYHADLTEGEQVALQASFCMRSVREAERILARALQREG